MSEKRLSAEKWTSPRQTVNGYLKLIFWEGPSGTQPALTLALPTGEGTAAICRQPCRIYFTTKFTIRPGTTIVFSTVLPASISAIFASPRAADSKAVLSASAGT